MRLLIATASAAFGAILGICLASPAYAHYHHHRHHNHIYHSKAHKKAQDRIKLAERKDIPTDEKSTTERPKVITGIIELMGHAFHFTSGGYGASIPYGDYRITTSSGPWGERHGALGLNDQEIYDPKLHREREGIEIHEARGGTEGCVGVHNGFGLLKKLVISMIDQTGSAWLHVWPFGTGISAEKWSGPHSIEEAANEEGNADHREKYAEEKHRRKHYAHHHLRYRHYANSRLANTGQFPFVYRSAML